MPSLSYTTAFRIASRELRASRGKFLFVILSVAIGVAALTGVRGFSAAFRSTLLRQARSIMAGDLAARTNTPLTPGEEAGLRKLASGNIEESSVTEMLSMASSSTSLDPLLVAIKAVDPSRYPFYGALKLRPAIPLTQALTDSSVVVGDDLLIRLHLAIGDSIKLGTRTFRIAAAVLEEPDRLSGAFAAGPRILLSQHALEQTGLLAPGSHATRRYLFKITPLKGKALNRPAEDAEVARAKAQLESVLPEASVTDYREANPALTRALDGATGLLSLMSLVALVLGAVGVAMAMRAHLASRLDSIAIMKSLGATSGQVLKIYTLQTLALGLAGGLLGIALGALVQLVFPLFLAKLLQLTPTFRVDPATLLLGLVAGLLVTLLFTLPPLLEIRAIRPILILRRDMSAEGSTAGVSWSARLRAAWPQLLTAAIIVLALAALASRVTDSRRVGGWFSGGLLVALLALFAVAAGLIALLRRFLASARFHLPSTLRHGLANLYRPGNPSAALLAALGLGVMQIALVFLVQHAVTSELAASTSAHLPNLFLIDITTDEVAPLRALLAAQPAVHDPPELLPVVSSRIEAIDNTPAETLRHQHIPHHVLQSISLTWAPTPDTPPPGDKVVGGAWWTRAQAAAAASHPLVAIEVNEAHRLHLRPGQHLTLAASDSDIVATVVAFFEADSQHAFSRAQYVLPEPALAGLPVVWYGGVHCDPTRTGEVRRALYLKFPSVTVIDVAATVETVRQVLVQITRVLQFLAAFSVFAGIVILASAIAGTRYRRVREVVVLKTLGATRPRIAAIYSVEFAVLGLIAGLTGLLFANLLAWPLLHRVLHFEYHFLPWRNLAAWLGTALLTVAAGWAASFRVLGQKPLEVLREE